MYIFTVPATSHLAAYQFKKGVSGNPSGRQRLAFDWFRKHTPEAQERLFFWLHSKNPKASLHAASLILAYSLGKPTEHHELYAALTLEQLLSSSWETTAAVPETTAVTTQEKAA